MNDIINRHNLFRPATSKADTKAGLTEQTARAIIQAEVESREAKTARLRQARLEMEAKTSTEPAPARPSSAKAPAPRRARSSR